MRGGEHGIQQLKPVVGRRRPVVHLERRGGVSGRNGNGSGRDSTSISIGDAELSILRLA
jgi:hypothetical protein